MFSYAAAGAEAQLLVPRALGLLAGSHQAPRDEWAAGWERVPLHVLLPWGAQMLSLLDGVAGDALLPTLKVTQPCGAKFDDLAWVHSSRVSHHR